MSMLIVLSADLVAVLMLSPKATSVFLWNATYEINISIHA